MPLPSWGGAAAPTFVRGLIPGFGQLYTARPVAGVAVLAAIGASQRVTLHEAAFVDAFGSPSASRIAERRRPYLTAGLVAGAVFALGAAVEASPATARAQRARPIVTVQTPPVPRRAPRGASVGGPSESPKAEVAIGVRVRF